ncbi:MAG: hypothetical protein QGG83_06175, partial [Candidatus Woesearchaeota archaeon]|nr:hypothetical protein [Candidatus Woesearchaeota archaeon]
RRHFIDSGTLRYFEFSVIECNRAAMETAFSHACDSSSGQLICVLPQNISGLKELVNVAKELTAEGGDPGPGKRTLFFFPKPIVGLENALREYEAWRWVSALSVLRGDRVARKETQARLMQAQDDLKIRLSGVFSIRGHPFNPSLSQWVHKGTVIDQVQVENNKLLQRYLSEELNDIYRNSPRLRNELIDRRELSSQGAAARNKLLNAMVASEGQERLGLTGAPAEATMYDALLGSSGIHAKYKSRLCFGIPRRLTKKTAPPDDLEQRERWVQVWKRIRKFMDKQATKAPRPVEELYDVLRQPPYGLLDGPLPVLLAAYYLSKKENAALFYEGLFVARPTPETFHLLARRPDLFSIQTHKTKRAEQHLLGQVHDLLKDIDLTLSATSEPKLIETVKALVMFEHSLPPYTKATRQIRPAEAREVARALRTAQAPKELIFQTIPKILGCS